VCGHLNQMTKLHAMRLGRLARAKIRDAMRADTQETHGPVNTLATAISDLRAEQRQTFDELRSTREELRQLHVELGDARTALTSALQVAVDDEPTTRRLLQTIRADPEYALAWDDPQPLVSIVIPTYTNWRLLEERALPSALAQTYPNIEVVIVGDAAPPETAGVIERAGDARVHYQNLGFRGPYPENDRQRWLVAGTAPMNLAMQLAKGLWIAFLNDDDAFRPEHVATLLGNARQHRTEVAYSKLEMHVPNSLEHQVLGTFPPANEDFGWQIALQHEALRFFEFELAAALFDEPGDWHRARRMLRAGVRFSQVDQVTCDYFPSQLWTDR
jgi:Glycosyl transferase family 2